MAHRSVRLSAREVAGPRGDILDTAAHVASVYGKACYRRIHGGGAQEGAKTVNGIVVPRRWICVLLHPKAKILGVFEKWEREEIFRPCCRRSEMHGVGGSGVGCARSRAAHVSSFGWHARIPWYFFFPPPKGLVIMGQVRIASCVSARKRGGVQALVAWRRGPDPGQERREQMRYTAQRSWADTVTSVGAVRLVGRT